VEHVQRILPTVSERRACRVINQPRPTQRRTLKTLDDEESLTRDIVMLAIRFGRYGYQKMVPRGRLELPTHGFSGTKPLGTFS